MRVDERGSRGFSLSGESAVARTAVRLRMCHDCTVTQTVLIVDDHPSFRASARAILEADGFSIVVLVVVSALSLVVSVFGHATIEKLSTYL